MILSASKLSLLCLFVVVSSFTSPIRPFGALPGSKKNNCNFLAAVSNHDNANVEHKPVGLIIRITVDPDRVTDFLNLLETAGSATRNEPGCIRFDVLRSQEQRNLFFMYQMYENQTTFEYRSQQPQYKQFLDFQYSGGVVGFQYDRVLGEFLG